MMSFNPDALDRHITGNWGEDQFTDVGTADRCGHQMRDGECNLDPDHRGRHTTVGFYCDYCGKMRRGQPIPVMQKLGDGSSEPVAEVCWFCTNVTLPEEQDRMVNP